MACEDLLTSRQRRQQQNIDAPALTESQVGGEEMEQYNDGLLTPGPSTPEARDGRNQNDSPSSDSEQHALDEQLAHEQPSNESRGSQDLSATQIEGYIPDRHQNNAPRRRNFDLDTDNIIEGLRRTRRTADY
jgi:hypothetical protein